MSGATQLCRVTLITVASLHCLACLSPPQEQAEPSVQADVAERQKSLFEVKQVDVTVAV